MIKTMNEWIKNTKAAEKNLDDFTNALIDHLNNDLCGLEKSGCDKALIESGYGFLEEQDNGLDHISKDLWKGYALGFMRGQFEQATEEDKE